jgi:hypothetical protein
MTTIITRLYASGDQAAAAANALRESEFDNDNINVFSAGADQAAAIRAAGVHDSASEIYASHLRDGAGLVVVRAPFGSAVTASRILSRFHPVKTAVKTTDRYLGTPDPRRREILPQPKKRMGTAILVCSDGLFPPAVIRGSSFFSEWLGLPLLSARTGKAKLVSGNSTPFSSTLGLPVLSKGRFLTR